MARSDPRRLPRKPAGPSITRASEVGVQRLLVVLVGLTTALVGIVMGASSATACGFASPSVSATYVYDSPTSTYDAPTLSVSARGDSARLAPGRASDNQSDRVTLGPMRVLASLSRFGVAAETGGDVLNAAGRAYPKVLDARTGDPIPAPSSGLSKVPVGDRVSWGAQERGAYFKDWYDQGHSTPGGGWSQYDIHHIIPREYGGTNDFSNLVPVLRTVHQQEFNPWWMNYGG